MNNKKLALNTGLVAVKNVCQIALPIIVFPYISRVLGVDRLGIFSFCRSIADGLILIAGLGIENYAIREGSAIKNDRRLMSDFASKMVTINIISAMAIFLLLFLPIIFSESLQNYRLPLVLLCSSVPFSILGCEWIFTVYEDFGYITFRNLAFQILSLILTLIFVRKPDDLIIYVFINAFCVSAQGIANIAAHRKYCNIRPHVDKSLFSHLAPIFVILANTVTVKLYLSSDMTILGFMCGTHETGLYTVSVKIYEAIECALSAVIIASTPRLSALTGNINKAAYAKTADSVLDVLLTLTLPAATGIFAVAGGVVTCFAGNQYAGSVLSLRILSIAIIFCMIGWFFNVNVLIPHKQEKRVLRTSLLAATMNIVLNFILIPLYQQNAAAFTTLLAEMTQMIFALCYGRKYYKHTIRKRNILSVITGCILIVVVCYISGAIIPSEKISLAVSILVSAAVYAAVLICMKNTVAEKTINTLRARLNKASK